ncbi:hypothetical protein [Deinococcus sp. QL22]|uniref:hypothetical protein n=1 Tax=Deinococcus sp. QL22 TaxID=2939437 RepID=UPI00201827AB|nr:hypothetical protein [Deinococcus sp. QL22]UQN10295.1 hypothetical protein M1R55_29530 [Deinococcus sp. QL22]UQN10429.1 hypothetical protein M1R55_28855 [Deinococcus sp. QL22]
MTRAEPVLSEHARRNQAQLAILRRAVAEVQASAQPPVRDLTLPVLRRLEPAPLSDVLL